MAAVQAQVSNTDVRCGFCEAPILDPAVASSFRISALPSARWMEMADLVQCADHHHHHHHHNHQQHYTEAEPTTQSADQPDTKSAAPAVFDMILRPEPHNLLLNPAVMVVHRRAVETSLTLDSGHDRLQCRRCRRLLGSATPTNFATHDCWILHVPALRLPLEVRPPALRALPPTIAALLFGLLDDAQAHSFSRFLVLAKDSGGDTLNPPHLFLWLPSLAPVYAAFSGMTQHVSAQEADAEEKAPLCRPHFKVLYAEACLQPVNPEQAGKRFRPENALNDKLFFFPCFYGSFCFFFHGSVPASTRHDMAGRLQHPHSVLVSSGPSHQNWLSTSPHLFLVVCSRSSRLSRPSHRICKVLPKSCDAAR